MRRYIKKQLEDLLNTMCETTEFMYTLFEENQINEVANLLIQQQNAAIALGEKIEESEGEGVATVRLLEEYCELLWSISQETSKTGVQDGVCRLQDVLQDVKQSFQKLPEQLEVVFMPYKASMWDCMESVWEAACADDTCYPIVVPIPYFDIKDGQIIERHYEGEMFPNYVPIADYRNLLLEELQPDMIFVHNAFDDYNKVTSVLPQFYSHKLRKVTKRLIYIPYFVTSGAVYVTHRYLPAYDNMDFIVTQCDKMIKSFAASIPKHKFLPFGSPIADRIVKLEREKPSIPKEWKSMLPNGVNFGGCRTVMLNTSISLLMKEKDRFLDKIEYLFDVAKGIQGIILIWRPHPLLHASAALLGETYALRLEQLEKRFLEEKIGVLDKTPDVGVTVALCDAYLGETASSLVHMFGIAGKPRFYINLEIPQGEIAREEAEYNVSGYCRLDDREILLLDEPGWVVEKAEKSGEVRPLFKIPDRENVRGRAYRGMEVRENHILLYPDNGQGILVYDRTTGRMRKVFDESLAVSYDRTMFEHTNMSENEEKTMSQPIRDLACIKAIRAERFARGNTSREWYEDEKYCLEDYFQFLLIAQKDELVGSMGMYSEWLVNLDGSCGRKILQAVKESLSEEVRDDREGKGSVCSL